VAKKNSKNGHTGKEQTEGTSRIAEHKNNQIIDSNQEQKGCTASKNNKHELKKGRKE
jgi:hypothetical protein